MSTSKPVVLGIDNGNYNTKTRNFSFLSGIKPVIEAEIKSGSYEEWLEFNGEYFVPSPIRAVVERDKTKDNTMLLLTLLGVGKELEHRIANNELQPSTLYPVYLSIGLPPTDIGLMDDYINYFKNFGGALPEYRDYQAKHGNNLEFTYNGTRYTINIEDIEVFQQGSVSYVVIEPSARKRFMTPDAEYYIVDIGGGTTDYLHIDSNKIKASGSLNKGTTTLYRRIMSKVSLVHRMDLREADVDRAIRKIGMSILPEEVLSTIAEERRLFFNELIGELLEYGLTFVTVMSLFVGGGALIFDDLIENSDKINPAISFIVSSINANAIGYEEVGKIRIAAKAKAQAAKKAKNAK